MTLQERLSLQAKNVTALIVRALDKMPSEDALIFGTLNNEWPENWIPLETKELYTTSSGVEIVAQDNEGIEVEMPAGEWVNMNVTRSLWEQVVSFIIESSRGRELFVVENTNTMVYVPKCKVMIETGLPDGSVMKAITASTGIQRHVKCPLGIEDKHTCQYPNCVGKLVDTPQPSIKAAKAAYRSQACVCLMKETRSGKMLFLTNGNNHLNLVPIDQAIATAWSSDWLKSLRQVLSDLEFDEPPELEEKLAILQGEEILRIQEAEEQYKVQRTNQGISLMEEALPENIVIKRKQED